MRGPSSAYRGMKEIHADLTLSETAFDKKGNLYFLRRNPSYNPSSIVTIIREL